MTQEPPRPAAQLPGVQAAWRRPVTFYHPVVYRCMAPRYVESFVKEGALRISSFAAFRRHKDEQRGDPEEATGMTFSHDSSRQRELSVFGTHAVNSYVLSTMLHVPPPDLQADLGGACFEIANVDAFACQVGNELAGCIAIEVGFCLYEEGRIFHTIGVDLPENRFDDDVDPTKVSLDKMMAAAAEASGSRVLFAKHPRYRQQNEFRFIWHINKPTADFIDIRLPTPLPYCRQV